MVLQVLHGVITNMLKLTKPIQNTIQLEDDKEDEWQFTI